MKQALSNKKKILITLGITLALIVCTSLILLVTAPSRVEGRWQCNVGYLQAYGCECIHTFILNEDGTFLNIISNANSEDILKTEAGTWSISGLKVKCRTLLNGSFPFTYNPITNILNNGGGLFPISGDVIFKKVS